MMTLTYPTIAVVGPGAIGTTVAAALHAAGRAPMLRGRTARGSLTLRDAEDIVVVPDPVRTDPAQAEGTVDLVFRAVKSTQIAAAAPWLAALCRTGTIVCAPQNGVEQESMIAPTSRGARSCRPSSGSRPRSSPMVRRGCEARCEARPA